MNFDWQTDEENQWEETPAAPEPAPTGRPRRRWLAALVVLLLLVAVSASFYWQLKLRVDQATSRIEEDVLASYSLVRSIAEEQDRELFISVLSGRDPNWTAIQKELVEEKALFDRSAFGFTEEAAEPTIVSVELSPDLMEAELLTDQGYTIDVGNGLTETIHLQQTTIFRLGGQTWLLSPPEGDFWGDWVVQDGAWLTLIYPERDAAVGERLAFDLDEKIGQMCSALADLNCPPAMPFTVRLDRSPAPFLPLVDQPAFWASSGREISLPAPTLVGLPVDEAGYQALYRGYAALIASAAITNLVEWQCCNHPLFYQALLDKQLNLLGLRPWPVTADGYETAANTLVNISTVELLWDEPYSRTLTAEEQWQLHATVDFLLDQATSSSVADLQRLMPASQTPFRSWLFNLSQFDPDFDNWEGQRLDREWLAFVYNNSSISNQPPPLELPNQDILLLCGQAPAVSLYRYDLAAENWSLELQAEQPFERMVALPDGRSVVLEGHSFLEDSAIVSWFTIWQDGQAVVNHWEAADSIWFSYFGASDPAGRLLMLQSASESRLLNLDQCGQTGCPGATPVSGYLTWSPDGRHTIADQMVLVDGERHLLHLADATGQTIESLETGSQPFWLNETTYGYIRSGGDGSAVMVGSLEEEAQPWLRPADLIAAIGEVENESRLLFYALQVNPADPNQLVLLARSGSSVNQAEDSNSYFLLSDRANDTLRPLFQLPDVIITMIQFSPDGRWLAVLALSGEQMPPGFQTLHLYELATGKQESYRLDDHNFFSLPVWSADSHWLLQSESTSLVLFAPEHDYRRPIFVPDDAAECDAMAWIEP